MEPQPQRQYILQDIMKKRKKNQQAIENKLRNKMTLKSKKKNKQHLYKGPQKFIGRYLAAQKSYSYLKKRNKKIALSGINKRTNGYGKLLIVIRIRGVHDISDKQKSILRNLRLRQVNSAVFIKGTPSKLKLLQRVHNYITYGQPSLKIIRQLIFKKMYGRVGQERIHINSNELVEQHIGGDIICIQDVVNQIVNMGQNFQNVVNFIFPFKLTTPPNTLVSRLRKPIQDGGHWGYRANQIDQYISNMI